MAIVFDYAEFRFFRYLYFKYPESRPELIDDLVELHGQVLADCYLALIELQTPDA
jgi:hypothetical protein